MFSDDPRDLTKRWAPWPTSPWSAPTLIGSMPKRKWCDGLRTISASPIRFGQTRCQGFGVPRQRCDLNLTIPVSCGAAAKGRSTVQPGATDGPRKAWESLVKLGHDLRSPALAPGTRTKMTVATIKYEVSVGVSDEIREALETATEYSGIKSQLTAGLRWSRN